MKFYTIYFIPVGKNKKEDAQRVDIWASSFEDAIKQFCEWDQGNVGIPCGFSWYYKESAIVKIEC